MGQASIRLHKRRLAKQVLSSICEQQSNYLVIHYSCESFFNIPDGRTPRITSIAVMYYESGQTKSFSIHKVAEITGVAFASISDNYDQLERKMLDEFSLFVSAHPRFKWIHLNMRNVNYGFEALSHRYMSLGGTAIEIDDNLKVDLGRLLSDLYGPSYIEHPHMEMLCRKNRLTMSHFLTGGEEAQAFVDKEYVKLHQSTLRKVENLHLLVDGAYQGTLKTNSTLVSLYGYTPQGIFQAAQENWLWALILVALTALATKLVFG